MYGCPGFAETPAEALQQELGTMHAMTADFSQEVKTKQRLLSKASGSMAILRPGRLRWATFKPTSQLVIADGKRLWIYDADLEQVSVKKQADGLDSAAGLLLNGAETQFIRDFDVSRHTRGQYTEFDLKALSRDLAFQRVILRFEGHTLSGMIFFDQLSQETTVLFQHIVMNPRLSQTLFTFNKPKGVDLVEG
jgi:outer membrane lipoprotein carrier protein